MAKQFVRTSNAPQPSGSYSQGIKVGSLLFVAGQAADDPKTGNILVTDIESQTRQALQNVKAVIEAAGLSMHNVVKTTVFLKNANDFIKMDAVYKAFFPENSPARMTVQVNFVTPGLLIEMDAIAYRQ